MDAQKRAITVLYADIVQSTQIVAGLNPDESSEFLDPYIDLMQRAVHQYGGRVVRVEGDGIKAVFGTVTAYEDHALRAALAGLMITQSARERLNSGIANAAALRVGIHSGFAIVRWQTTDFGGGVDTVGATAHIAAKVQAAAPHNAVCISENTAALLNTLFTYTQNEILYLGRGADPIDSYILSGADLDAASIALPPRDSQFSFLGREAQMKMLRAALDFDNPQRARTVYIIGEPGVGKSRLTLEAAGLATKQGLPVLKIRGFHVFKDSAYRLVRLLYQQLSQGLSSLSQAGLNRLEAEAFEKICGDSSTDFAEWNKPGDLKATTLHTALSKLVRANSTPGGLLIVLEDAHNADQDSLSTLQAIMPDLRDERCAVIITARPHNDLPAPSPADSVITLSTLSPAHSESLVLQGLGPRPSSRQLQDAKLILERANGLPLALIELTKLARETHASRAGELVIPLSLEPTLRHRLDQVSSDAKTFVQHASLLGRGARPEDLASLLGWEKLRAFSARNELIVSGILRELESGETSESGDIAFSHDLFQEVCIHGVIRSTRKTIHERIYQFLKAKPETSPEILSAQAYGAGNTQAAIQHLRTAFSQANSAGALQTVWQLYGRAQILCETIDDADYHLARFAMLAFDASHRLTREADLLHVFERALNTFDDRLTMAEKILVRAHIGLIKWVSGNPKNGLAYTAEARAMLGGMDHLALESYVNYVHACAQFATGHVQEAAQGMKAQAKRLSGESASKRWGQSLSIPGILVRTFGAWHAVDLGDFNLARQLIKQASDIANEDGNAYGLVLRDLAEGYLCYRTGHYAKGAEILQLAYESAANTYFSLAPMTAAWGALCIIETGDLSTAEALIETELKAKRIERMRNSNRFYLYLAHARLYRAQGFNAQALNRIDDAIDSAQASKSPVSLAYGYECRARFLGDDDSRERERYLSMAMTLARQCRMETLMEKCRQKQAEK